MDAHEGGQHKPLPVQRESIGAQVRVEGDAASALSRLQQQMHFRIVPEGFIVADTLDRGSNRFAVDDGRRSEGDGHAEAFFREIPDDLSLDLAHNLGGYLFCARIIFDSKHRLLFLKKFQVMQGCHRKTTSQQSPELSEDCLTVRLLYRLPWSCLAVRLPHWLPGSCLAVRFWHHFLVSARLKRN